VQQRFGLSRTVKNSAEHREDLQMASSKNASIGSLVTANEQTILPEWIELQKRAGSLQTGRMTEAELQSQSRKFLHLLRDALATGGSSASDAAYEPVKEMLGGLSRSRALQGFSPSETATFIFSLKQPLFSALSRDKSVVAGDIMRGIWDITLLLDQLGLYTLEIFQQSREEVIQRQQREIAELSTPVVKLWEDVLALPLIGTLDSQRTQVIMENLLQSIVDYGAQIAIIDITGVPTVDTLTAQHLIKTVAAARLMGADCIISGIRPQIAQTMVHLGVELNVISKATLADALALALRRTGRGVHKLRPEEATSKQASRRSE
jgi:rsbT co-antagonist protein RsbR